LSKQKAKCNLIKKEKQTELNKYLEEITLLKEETCKMQDALKEQAMIMQEAHRKYRQQKQAKFNKEISTLKLKH
jgi:hypothetical protein